MTTTKLILGDCLEKLKQLEENSIDAIVTDPPYGLGFMNKKWDKFKEAKEFQNWFYNISIEMFRVLKPGAHLLSFGGTRTYHRMATAIEDAGFEIRDMIEWIYSQGFPKSQNIGKQIDKLQGNKREILGKGRHSNIHSFTDATKYSGTDFRPDITRGTSEWEGWGTALKPAHEPICVARKPLDEKTIAKNILKYRTGGLNIDASRIEYSSKEDKEKSGFGDWGYLNPDVNFYIPNKQPTIQNDLGRFPANLIHDGSDEVLELFPNNSARFFYCAKASSKERNKGCENIDSKEVIRQGLAGEHNNPKHNNHPTLKPLKLMRYLVKLITPTNGIVLDPFMGSGTTGIAAKLENFSFVGIEINEDYFIIAKSRIKNYAA